MSSATQGGLAPQRTRSPTPRGPQTVRPLLNTPFFWPFAADAFASPVFLNEINPGVFECSAEGCFICEGNQDFPVNDLSSSCGAKESVFKDAADVGAVKLRPGFEGVSVGPESPVSPEGRRLRQHRQHRRL